MIEVAKQNARCVWQLGKKQAELKRSKEEQPLANYLRELVEAKRVDGSKETDAELMERMAQALADSRAEVSAMSSSSIIVEDLAHLPSVAAPPPHLTLPYPTPLPKVVETKKELENAVDAADTHASGLALLEEKVEEMKTEHAESLSQAARTLSRASSMPSLPMRDTSGRALGGLARFKAAGTAILAANRFGKGLQARGEVLEEGQAGDLVLMPPPPAYSETPPPAYSQPRKKAGISFDTNTSDPSSDEGLGIAATSSRPSFQKRKSRRMSLLGIGEDQGQVSQGGHHSSSSPRPYTHPHTRAHVASSSLIRV